MKSKSRRFIYALFDPVDQRAHYIGCTADPAKRFRDHRDRALDGYETTPKALWIRSLYGRGYEPEMVILAVCSREDAESDEEWFIREALALGEPLTNIREGDTPAGERSEAARQHMRAARLATQADMCRRGHAYTPENTEWQTKADGRVSRRCRTCTRARRSGHVESLPPLRFTTECPAGHVLSGPNLYVDPSGKRRCRLCTKRCNQESRERRLANASQQ